MIFSLDVENHIALESLFKTGFSLWPHIEAEGDGENAPVRRYCTPLTLCVCFLPLDHLVNFT